MSTHPGVGSGLLDISTNFFGTLGTFTGTGSGAVTIAGAQAVKKVLVMISNSKSPVFVFTYKLHATFRTTYDNQNNKYLIN